MVNLVLILDEINQVPEDTVPAINEMLHELGDTCVILTPLPLAGTHKIALLPIISGTMMKHLQKEIVFNSFYCEIEGVPLLGAEAIASVFSHLFPTKTAWLNNKIFRRT
jgi:hypothetical protein